MNSLLQDITPGELKNPSLIKSPLSFKDISDQKAFLPPFVRNWFEQIQNHQGKFYSLHAASHVSAFEIVYPIALSHKHYLMRLALNGKALTLLLAQIPQEGDYFFELSGPLYLWDDDMQQIASETMQLVANA